MKRNIMSIIMVGILIMNYVWPFGNVSLASDQELLLLEMKVNRAEAVVGEGFIYSIKYTYPSQTVNAINALIVDTLPDGVEIVPMDEEIGAGAELMKQINITDDIENVTRDGNKVTFHFKNPLEAGSTGVIQMKVKFKEGITAPDTVVANSATFTADNAEEPADQLTNNTVDVKAIVNPSDWSVDKEIHTPASTTPALDQPVTYELTVNGNNDKGGLNLVNIAMVDTLPPNTVYVSASDGGSYDADSHAVTWQIPLLQVDNKVKRRVTIKYPSSYYNIADTPSNNMTVTAYEYATNTELILHKQLQHNISIPKFELNGFEKTSRQANDEYAIGQEAIFHLLGIGNGGNVPVNSFTIIDAIPSGINLKSVTTGKYNGEGLVHVFYTTNITNPSHSVDDTTVWQQWVLDQDATASTTLAVSTLALQADEYINYVKWQVGGIEEVPGDTDTIDEIYSKRNKLPPGFNQISKINIKAEIMASYWNGNLTQIGDSITNTATISMSEIIGDKDNPILNEVKSTGGSVTIRLVDPRPWLVATKEIMGGSAYYEEERVNYRLTVKNHNYSTGNLIHPVVLDSMPDELEDIIFHKFQGSTNWNAVSTSAPTWRTATIDGKSVELYKINLDKIILKPGEFITIEYSGKIKEDTVVGLVNNTMYMTVPSDFKGHKIPDTDNIDENAVTTHYTTDTATFFVRFRGSLKSEKWIKGELDTNWNRYPEVGKTLPGGKADYQLTVSNSGSNGPISNVVVMDVLPYVGDHGLIDTRARDTIWVPYLVNEVRVADASPLIDRSKIKIYYSKDKNPSLSQLHDPRVKNHTGWSETIDGDITEITAIKFDFGDIELNVNDFITLEWPMRAPKEAPHGEVAWNSFGYGATYPDEGGPEPFLPSEPIKVGYEIKDDPIGQAKLGDYVWEDLNKNGIQDAGEPGINGVLIKLLETDGTQYKYTRSGKDHNGKDGYYLFPNLPPDTYVVEFELPTGYEYTPKGVGGDGNIDSDVDVSTGKSDAITLIADDTNLDIDAGIYREATLGDYIWHDRNANGKQDSGDVVLANITVNLYNADNAFNTDSDTSNDVIMGTEQTNSQGKYQFTGLDPGNYFIRVVNNGDYKLTNSEVGSDRAKDSNLDSSGQSDTIFLQSGETNLDIDGGMYMATLGDYVWHDRNANGVQESGEPGIRNVRAKLYKNNIYTGKDDDTDGNGKYTFADLTPGDYHIEFMKPSGYDRFSLKDQNTGTPDDAKDSDGTADDVNNPTLSTTGIVTLAAGDRNNALDQGVYKLASIGDKVWNDLNHNGKQDSGEPGIANVEVELQDKDGNSLIPQVTDITDSNGNYLIGGIVPGTYRLDFNPTQPTLQPYVITGKDVGTDNAKDSDIDSNGKILNITLSSGDHLTNMDAGFHKSRLGNYVWEDMNADGIWNDGDTGINNVEVKLYRHDGDMSDDVAIDAMYTGNYNGLAGYYMFTDLDPDNYYVEFNTWALPDTYETVPMDVGADTTDSDYLPATQKTNPITLAKGIADETVDAGYYRPAAIGNYIWNDLDGNGKQDTAEPGVNGISVSLYSGVNGYSTPVAQQLTSDLAGKAGYYQFHGLRPGNYKIKFTTGLYDLFTKKNLGANGDGKIPDEIDSDVDHVQSSPTHGWAIETTLESNEKDMTWDAGLIKYGSIGNYVWEDKNIDGLQDGDESGISGSTVRLYHHDGSDYVEVSQMLTDANGLYVFDKLIPGAYQVGFDDIIGYMNTPIRDAGSDDQIDSDIEYSHKQTTTHLLTSGEDYLGLDAGYYQVGSIGNYIWHDLNANGLQDTGEAGISGVLVRLLDDGDGLVATINTDANGQYMFQNKPIGKYKIKVDASDTKLTDYILSPPNEGSNDTIDSDLDDTTYESQIINLGPNEDIDTLDGGFYKLGTIGDYVWEDMNGNGIQDGGEPAISGVKVTITKPDSSRIEMLTDANGMYTFSSLIPGVYTLSFEMPSGYAVTDPRKTSDEALDSNPDKTTLSSTVTLSSGENKTTVDAGFYRLVKLGDYVWIDQNNNGIQEAGEKGAKDVKVELTKPDHTTEEVTTGEDGKYIFENLTPGEHEVAFKLPSGYGFVPSNKGSTSEDSNADTSTGSSGRHMLFSGSDDLTIDAGIYLLPVAEPKKTGAIGDYVWYDADGDGIQDKDEVGIAGVKVTLSSWGLDLVTHTNSHGSYLFENLPNGSYSLKFSKPSGYEYTKRGVGHSNQDSNVSSTGWVDAIYIYNGETITTIDAGLIGTGEIGDYVWEDRNDNHVQDKEDVPYQGLTVSLYSEEDYLLDEMTTDSKGNYLFPGLRPGKYYIGVSLPVDYVYVRQDEGSNDAEDSDVNKDGKTAILSLGAGESNLTIDIGLVESQVEEAMEEQDLEKTDEPEDITEGLKDKTDEEPLLEGKIEKQVAIHIIDHDDDGPLSHAKVIIRDMSGKIIKEDMTNGEGSIALSSIPDGGITIDVMKDGYVTERHVLLSGREGLTLELKRSSRVDSDSILPVTGTSDYQFLLLGILLLIGGVIILRIDQRRKVKE